MSDIVKITVLNFDEYNPRRGQKKYSWFRFDHKLMESDAMNALTDAEFRAWIWILSRASVCSLGGLAVLNCRLAARTCRVRAATLRRTIKKLSDYGIISENPIHEQSDKILERPLRNDTIRNASREAQAPSRAATSNAAELELQSEPKRKPSGSKKSPTPGMLVWDAYQESYLARYGVDPARNARVNSQCSNLAKLLGDDAIEVVKFFLTHDDPFYVRTMHTLSICVRDAESLCAQWKLGTPVSRFGQSSRPLQGNLD